MSSKKEMNLNLRQQSKSNQIAAVTCRSHLSFLKLKNYKKKMVNLQTIKGTFRVK